MPELHTDSTNEFGKVSSTTAALRAWAETQPQTIQFIAETLADQVDELERAPDSELLHDSVVDSLGKLGLADLKE